MSADHMPKRASRLLRSAVCWAVAGVMAFGPAVANAQTAIGGAVTIVRSVSGTLNNSARTIKLKDKVYQNELIQTRNASATHLAFLDDTILTVGPNSQVMLDSFVYDSSSSTGKMAITLGKGVFRFISGKLPKRSYLIKTPTATIGIRGTILTVMVAPSGATTVAVEQGVVAVSNAAGASVSVNPGLSSTVNPASGGVAPPPSPPGPPPPAMTQAVNSMDSTAGAAPGAAGGGAASASAAGGLTVGAIAAGIAIAAALAAIVAAITSDDDAVSSSTSTSTSTSSSTSTSTSSSSASSTQ